MDLTPIRRRCAAAIHSLRQTRGATQEELAAELHVSSQAVRMWEKGTSEPRLSQFIALCLYMGAEPAEVMKSVEAETHAQHGEDIERMRAELGRFLMDADADFIRSAYQMTFRLRRPMIMQLFLAYLGLPLHRQQRNAWAIIDDWHFADRHGELRRDVPRPNMQALEEAHSRGHAAAMEGDNDYLYSPEE